MFLKLLSIISLIFFTACYDNKPVKKLNGKKLLTQKCASCHDLAIPPMTTPEDIAPPIMAVSFHVLNFVKPADETQRLQAAKDFVIDYAQFPNAEKSFCDKESLEKYGLMPSQKENVNKAELIAITEYMLNHYTRKTLLQAIKAKAAFESIPFGKRIALKNGCISCHRVDKNLVGPSFINIAKKFKNSQDDLKISIRKGSKGKWKDFKATMPPHLKINDEDLEKLTKWILDKKSK